MSTADTSDLPRARDLLARGAALEAKDIDNETAMTWAVRFGSPEFIRGLLEYSPNLFGVSKEGRNALHHLTRRYFEDAFEVSLEFFKKAFHTDAEKALGLLVLTDNEIINKAMNNFIDVLAITVFQSEDLSMRELFTLNKSIGKKKNSHICAVRLIHWKKIELKMPAKSK